MPTPLLDNRQLGPDVARANLLTNGGFEIWQRGNGSFSPSGSMTADRWQGNPNGTTMAITREASVVDIGSLASAKFDISGGVGTQPQPFGQVVKDVSLRGKTVSFSIRARAPSVGSIRTACVWDGTGGGVWMYGALNIASSVWETLTYTFTVPADATYVWVNVSPTAVGTYYLDNACLVVGSQPADYVPLHPADDLARCLRYYEIIGDVNGIAIIAGYANSVGAYLYENLRCITKAIVPTVTKNGTWSTSGNQPAVTFIASNYVVISASSTAVGMFNVYSSGVGANITIEANP